MSSALACRASCRAGPRRLAPPMPALRALQQQQRRGLKGRLDGPLGQQAPPKNPGGTDAARRNWMWAAGIGLAAVLSASYTSQSKSDVESAVADNVSAAAKEDEVMARSMARDKSDASKPLGEMSGRTRTGTGGSRSD